MLVGSKWTCSVKHQRQAKTSERYVLEKRDLEDLVSLCITKIVSSTESFQALWLKAEISLISMELVESPSMVVSSQMRTLSIAILDQEFYLWPTQAQEQMVLSFSSALNKLHILTESMLSLAAGSDTIPMEAGQIKKGGLIMIKGRPCKVSEVTTSKTGKHGHAKCNFTTYDIFTNKKLEDMIPSTHGTTVPNVTRQERLLTDIDDDDFMTLMDDDGNERSDLKLPKYPETAAAELRAFYEETVAKDEMVSVTVLVFGNQTEEMVIAWKVDKS